MPFPSPVNNLPDLNDKFLLESNRDANISYVIVADDDGFCEGDCMTFAKFA